MSRRAAWADVNASNRRDGDKDGLDADSGAHIVAALDRHRILLRRLDVGPVRQVGAVDHANARLTGGAFAWRVRPFAKAVRA